jgi:hypothetical protein
MRDGFESIELALGREHDCSQRCSVDGSAVNDPRPCTRDIAGCHSAGTKDIGADAIALNMCESGFNEQSSNRRLARADSAAEQHAMLSRSVRTHARDCTLAL